MWATAAAIWSTRPCIRRRIRRASSGSSSPRAPSSAAGAATRRRRPVPQPDELARWSASVASSGASSAGRRWRRRRRRTWSSSPDSSPVRRERPGPPDAPERPPDATLARPGGRVPSSRYRRRGHADPSRPRRRIGGAMDLGLAGARALVGGGSGGLGGAVGATLAGEGARVALAARPSDRLDAAVARIAGAVAVAADLASTRRPGRRGRPDRGGLRRPRPAARQLRRPAARDVRGARRGSLGTGDRRDAVERDPARSARRCRTFARATARRSSSTCRRRRASRSPG